MHDASPRRAVFLDRDGTIIEDADYLTSADELRILSGAVEGLKRLRQAGLLLLVVTNQSAVARGWLTEAQLQEIHRELQGMLRAEGAVVDDFFYCPHLPEGDVEEYAVTCSCRKPAPGLIEAAAAKWNVDTSRSFAVGDSERDVVAGQAANCYGILLAKEPSIETAADAVVSSLEEAADVILARLQSAI